VWGVPFHAALDTAERSATWGGSEPRLKSQDLLQLEQLCSCLRYHWPGNSEISMSDNVISRGFSKFATLIADLSGKPATFVLAVALVVVWAASGPVFDYSENWQLVINTSTTIITFLMVFVLQNSQNRDGKALQAKLDELILTSQAQNKFVGIEKLDEQQLREMSQKLAERAHCVEEVAEDKAEERERRPV